MSVARCVRTSTSPGTCYLYILLTAFFFMHAGPVEAQVITACANNVNGELRRVTSAGTCRNNESAVTWSVQGPQGAQGPQGIQGETGATGAPGASGVSKIYATSAQGYQSLTTQQCCNAPRPLLKELSLPAGSYSVSAKVNIFTSTTQSFFADCTLGTGPNTESGGPDLLDLAIARGGLQITIFGDIQHGTSGSVGNVMSLNSVVTLAAPGVVQVRCGAFPDGFVTWSNLKLSATQLNSVEIQ